MEIIVKCVISLLFLLMMPLFLALAQEPIDTDLQKPPLTASQNLSS